MSLVEWGSKIASFGVHAKISQIFDTSSLRSGISALLQFATILSCGFLISVLPFCTYRSKSQQVRG